MYQYFGALFGCSFYATDGFAKYDGKTSMYDVHKYMGLGAKDVGYFIQQLQLSTQSLGFSNEDVNSVGIQLATLFGQRCLPKSSVVPDGKKELQAICIAVCIATQEKLMCTN